MSFFAQVAVSKMPLRATSGASYAEEYIYGSTFAADGERSIAKQKIHLFTCVFFVEEF